MPRRKVRQARSWFQAPRTIIAYAADQQPGDTAGQGLKQFGAGWYVLAPMGNKIDNE
jgi:hypothetical protein